MKFENSSIKVNMRKLFLVIQKKKNKKRKEMKTQVIEPYLVIHSITNIKSKKTFVIVQHQKQCLHNIIYTVNKHKFSLSYSQRKKKKGTDGMKSFSQQSGITRLKIESRLSLTFTWKKERCLLQRERILHKTRLKQKTLKASLNSLHIKELKVAGRFLDFWQLKHQWE